MTEWTVRERSSNGVDSPKKKLPFVTPIKIVESMDDNQKTFFTNYNNMQKELIKNGLMESK